jgi:hypothetical protein
MAIDLYLGKRRDFKIKLFGFDGHFLAWDEKPL